ALVTLPTTQPGPSPPLPLQTPRPHSPDAVAVLTVLAFTGGAARAPIAGGTDVRNPNAVNVLSGELMTL
ncbi:hypothetical protein ACWEAF_42685, partial [Streptomyces sp. NPDC005071]